YLKKGKGVVLAPRALVTLSESLIYEIDDGVGRSQAIATIEISGVNHWQNFANPMDVNDDGKVSPLDALVVINELARSNESDPSGAHHLSGTPTPGGSARCVDVNSDNFVSPIDALIVINYLSRVALGEAELVDPFSNASLAPNIGAMYPLDPSVPLTALKKRDWEQWITEIRSVTR
ncbi:MAG: hypothetical protein KDB00_05065, partial [Planctomycetales bacterium]|nr:hypothetical protein [Planctomycetales bacterium]